MRADARRNYERIINVAREAFTEHGPEAPLDDIARRACVGPGTLYRHFPNREALIEAVYRADIEKLAQRATELAEARSPGDALAEWVREQVGFVVQNHGLAATLKAAIDRDSETFALCKVMLNDAAAKIVKAAQEAGVLREDVQPRDIMLMAHGVGAASQNSPDAAPRMVAVMLDGLRRQEP
ncbi:TetR/AcrR family transcriptional regulator [Amycolatopsis alkalitolerans]|uniref:TetR/AcrR family transcriptional regulator n=2 Tax=Amycolatopsis alkalitolerans TaxID=2547244 RepID=A0A5C4LUB3_9PSEU|nr:TetR/AcrR family transcriptional regulator [Amycolatopsis alkalitolerans]